VVVFVDELVEQSLELDNRRGLNRLSAQPLLERLLEPLDFALSRRAVRSAVLLDDVQSSELVLEGVASALASDASESDGGGTSLLGAQRRAWGKTMPLSVNVDAGIPALLIAARNSASTMGVVTRRWAVTRIAMRVQSSSQVRISTSVPSASR
jgi:hypothetical protein